MADEPRIIRLARLRMLATTTKRPEKMRLPVRGSSRGKRARIERVGDTPPKPRLRTTIKRG